MSNDNNHVSCLFSNNTHYSSHCSSPSLILGPSLNQPLNVPKAVSSDWRNDTVYKERLWGTYRY